MKSPPTGGLFHSPLINLPMKLFTMQLLFCFILLGSCSSVQENDFKFSKDESEWLKHHGLYNKAINLPEEKKRKIASIIQIELSMGSELKSLADSLSIKFPDVGIVYSGPRHSQKKDSTTRYN